MSIEVTDELIAHIARLSRLALSPEEAREMGTHFEKVLRFVAELESLDLREVDPSPFSLEASSVLREDEVRPSLSPELSVANAPERKDTFFVVPRIIAEAPDGESSR